MYFSAMRFLFTILLAAASFDLYSQQQPTIEEVIKKLQQSEILPVRKPFTNFTSVILYRRGPAMKDSVVYLPASPPNPVYFPEEDQRLFSTLSTSVKNYLADLERKKKKMGE